MVADTATANISWVLVMDQKQVLNTCPRTQLLNLLTININILDWLFLCSRGYTVPSTVKYLSPSLGSHH